MLNHPRNKDGIKKKTQGSKGVRPTMDASLFMQDNIYKKYTSDTSLIGSQFKFEVTLNGSRGIFKLPQFDGSFDCFTEEFCYHLANQLGVPHCYQQQLIYHGQVGVFSKYETDHVSELRTLEEVIETSEPVSTRDIVVKLRCGPVIVQYTKAVLFDLLTRQIDRNTGNMSFRVTPFSMYPLFDSGLSLFSTFADEQVEAVLDRNVFRMRYGLSRDYAESLDKSLAQAIVNTFRFNFDKILAECFIPPNVTQFRLTCMRYWLDRMLNHLKEYFNE